MLGRLMTLPLAAAVLVLSTGGAHAQPTTFELAVSPTSGTTGDRFKATVTIQIAGVAGPDRYWHPDTPGFTVADMQIRPTTTMQYDPKHGQQLTTTEIRTYTLVPKKTGRLYIGPAKLRLGGAEYETKQIAVDVADAGSGPTASSSTDPDPTAAGGVGAPGFRAPQVSGRPDLFLHAVVDETEPWLGEQVICTWLLYARDEVLKFEPSAPDFDGLWTEKLYEPDRYLRYHDDYVNGIRYRVAIIAKRAVFPTRSGTLEVAPFAAKVSTLYSSLNDQKEVESPPLTLHVKPLPPGAPAGFDPSYVGEFTATASVDRTELEAGESLTLTLEVEGRGAIRRTTAPELKAGGFEFRTPRDFDEKVDTTTDVVRGSRIYRYWTTPQQGGAQTIPPLTIPYFNPESGTYHLAQTQPLSIMVRGDPATLGGATGRENFIAPDIRLIRDSSTISSVTMARAYGSHWYWLLVAAPIVAFIGVTVVDIIRRRRDLDTPRSRIRRARGNARKRFKVADIHLRGNRPSKFFGELARAIYEHLEERIGQPVHGMTREELAATLAEHDFPSETIAAIRDELENCDFARFTPAASGPGEMRAARERTEELLRAIERAPTGAAGDEA
jgi:hypothetical protein